jgi:glycosyltransferase involved in cell wall biosynthesis
VSRAAYRALSAADALVFEADATRQLYERWARPDATLVVPYGIDTSAVVSYCDGIDPSTARNQLGLPERCRLALVMGTFEPRKEQTQIVRAFEAVGDEHPDWVLALVGDFPSPYSEGLKAQVRRSPMADRVVVVPIVKDTFAWYRAADVLLSASDMESMPRSALEAMAFGVPYVAASVFGVQELISDGLDGFLFEPNDLHALVGAMRRVFSMESSRLRTVGENARTLAMERYDSSGYATEFRRLFRVLAYGYRDPLD